MEKNFEEWIKIKKYLHNNAKMPTIKEREVWWCSMGENVGIEINGKGKRFLRPVLILKKLSKNGFLGVPLTSQEHKGNWYANFIFLDKKQYASLCQIRVISVSRLHDKMGTIPMSDFKIIKDAFHKLYK